MHVYEWVLAAQNISLIPGRVKSARAYAVFEGESESAGMLLGIGILARTPLYLGACRPRHHPTSIVLSHPGCNVRHNL